MQAFTEQQLVHLLELAEGKRRGRSLNATGDWSILTLKVEIAPSTIVRCLPARTGSSPTGNQA